MKEKTTEEERLRIDPKGVAGLLKDPMQFIPLNALKDISRVMRLGSEKYGENNWLFGAGVGMLTYKGAILRHLTAIDRGEDIDPESGVSHWAHIASSAMIILDAKRAEQLIDDRTLPKPKVYPDNKPVMTEEETNRISGCGYGCHMIGGVWISPCLFCHHCNEQEVVMPIYPHCKEEMKP